MNRLYYEAETKEWISDKQAGFRTNKKIPECMHAVVKWISAEKKMVINVEKTEIFFSIETKVAKRRPNNEALVKDVTFTPSPKFLGLYLNRTLTFAKHVNGKGLKVVTEKVKSRNRMLASLISRKWGWIKRSMRKFCTTMQRSVINYAAALAVQIPIREAGKSRK